jgi:hypothetical protein
MRWRSIMIWDKMAAAGQGIESSRSPENDQALFQRMTRRFG